MHRLCAHGGHCNANVKVASAMLMRMNRAHTKAEGHCRCFVLYHLHGEAHFGIPCALFMGWWCSLCLVFGQERNYIVVLLLMSLAMLSIPIYHEYKLPIW